MGRIGGNRPLDGRHVMRKASVLEILSVSRRDIGWTALVAY